MAVLDKRIQIGALHLVGVAERVLGAGASPCEKYHYVSGLLSRLSRGMPPTERARLRVECWAAIFYGDEVPPDDSRAARLGHA